jgi:hypothetical protein
MDIFSKVLDSIVAGDLTFAEIAERYNMTLADVNTLFEEYMDQLAEEYEYDDSMDGDFDSAMASAGYGTDEDYGYYGEEF